MNTCAETASRLSRRLAFLGGWGSSDVAERIGVTRQTVWRWTREGRIPKGRCERAVRGWLRKERYGKS